MAHSWRFVVWVAPFGVVGACNGLLGIDAPTRVPDDGGEDSGGEDSPSIEGGATTDASVADGPTADATPDGPSDAAGDAGFDGNCTCLADACAPTVLAKGQNGPGWMALGSAGVYWTTDPGDTVGAATFDGKVAVLGPPQSNPAAIAFQSGTLFWANASNGALETCTLPNCSPTKFASNSGGHLVATDSQNVYFEDFKHVLACPLTGCVVPTTIAMASTLGGLASDGTNVYWSQSSSILSCPVTGCGVNAPTTVASGETGPGAVATDGANVYWVTFSEIRQCPIANCDANKMSIVQSDSPHRLAVGGNAVYWTNSSSGDVRKVPIGGGPHATLASHQDTPTAIAVGSSCVFWTNDPTSSLVGAVLAVAK